jgi:hypothetical protein
MIMSDYHGDEHLIFSNDSDCNNDDSYWQACNDEYEEYYEENE